MDASTIIAILGFCTTIAGYLFGRRKTNIEADKTAFESYNFALLSLRKEFEARAEAMRNDYADLKAKYLQVVQENMQLRERVTKLENK